MSTRVEEIGITEFDLSLLSMRLMNLDRIAGLEKSMKVHGQLQPVIARLYEGGVQMIDGFKRLYAAETLLMDTLECRLFEVDESQAKIMLLSYNRSNQSMEVWEEAMVLKDLLERHDLELQVTKEAHLLFKVIDQRYKDNKSLIFTSNIEEEDWPEFLGDPVSTSAILDRIFHHSVIVKIYGPSYRQYQGELLQKKYGENKEAKENKEETG